jgi:hypothetical protein
LRGHQIDWQLQRDTPGVDFDPLDVVIRYDIEPYVPTIVSGPADNWSASEGGCVTDMEAFKAGTDEVVELTAEEREEIRDWIERNHDHDEDRFGDPDAAYDAWRDERDTRDNHVDW